MNYLQQINKFYDWMETHNTISKNAISLWYALMHVNSKSKWSITFTTSLATLELKTRIKRSDLYKARKELKECGLINWGQQGVKQSAFYTLNSITSIIDAEVAEEISMMNEIKNNHELYPGN